jgi:hypothetical protein
LKLNFRGVLVILQVLGMFLATAFAADEIESILVSGPALSLAGILIAFLAYLRRAVRAFYFGVYAPTASLVCFLLIYTQRWGPPEARIPISSLMILLTLAAIPFGAMAVYDFSRTPPATGRRRGQFGIATLLGLTASIAFVLGLLRVLETPALVAAFSTVYVAIVLFFAFRIAPAPSTRRPATSPD